MSLNKKLLSEEFWQGIVKSVGPRSENVLKLVLVLQLSLQFVDFCLRFFVLENLIKLINQLVEGT